MLEKLLLFKAVPNEKKKDQMKLYTQQNSEYCNNYANTLMCFSVESVCTFQPLYGFNVMVYNNEESVQYALALPH